MGSPAVSMGKAATTDVASWNARAFAPGAWREGGRAARQAGAKSRWLAARLKGLQPDVVFLQEVRCTSDDVRALRRVVASLWYGMSHLSDRGGGPNGVVALFRKATTRMVRHARVCERALGIIVQHRGDACERAYVGVHGVHCDSGFKKQRQAIASWLDARGGGVASASHA